MVEPPCAYSTATPFVPDMPPALSLTLLHVELHCHQRGPLSVARRLDIADLLEPMAERQRRLEEKFVSLGTQCEERSRASNLRAQEVSRPGF